MEKKSFHTGVLYALLSALSLSGVGLFGKLGTERLSLTALIFWRFSASLLLCALLLFFLRRVKWEGLKRTKGYALRAVFTLGAQYSFYYYLEQNTLMNAMVLLNTGPLFIPLIERVVVGSKIGKSTIASLIVGFAGVLCVLQPDQGIFTLMSLIGLLSGFCQGISQVLFGINVGRERYDLGVLSLFFFTSLFSLLPFLFGPPAWETGADWGWAVWLIGGLAMFSTANQLFRGAAYECSTPSRLSPFLYIAVPMAGVFDWAVFGKDPNLLSLIGAALVILAGLLKIYLRHIILRSQNR